ncbi:MAG: hypothetical protein Q4D23_03360 [Bacteroidales bacterium]|nr:hypothetical protein [Bacteroidales bacterium]
MKKIFTLFLLAFVCCLNAAAQFVPEDGKQYVIKDARSDYYIVLAVGNDSQASDTDNTTQASLGVTGTPFTFTPSGMGFVLSTDEGKYLGIGLRPWNVGTTSSAVWTVNNYEEATGLCNIYLSTTSGKGLGLDNHTIGSGVYTDKSGQYWKIEEYVAPEEVHTVTATVDGVEYTMLEDGEGGYIVTIPEVETGDHSVTVSFDGEEFTETFTTNDYKVFDSTVSVGKVNIHFKDGVITVTGDGIGGSVDPQPSYPPLYVLGFDNNWDYANPSLTVDANEDGTYTITFDATGYSRMAISAACGDRDTFDANRIGVTDEDAELKTGNVLDLVRGGEGYNISLTPRHWSFLVDLDAMTLTILEGESANTLYVLGIDGNWNPAKPSLTVQPNKEGDYVFSYTVSEKTWFCLGTKLGADSDDWKTFNANRLSAPDPDYELFLHDMVLLTLGGENSFAIQPGTWTFSVNKKMNEIKVTDYEGTEPDGIQTITTSAAAPIYDMQGRRVAAPVKGLYIQNGKTFVK